MTEKELIMHNKFLNIAEQIAKHPVSELPKIEDDDLEF